MDGHQRNTAWRHALINSEGEVVNVILLSPDAKWFPPEGHTVVKDEKVNRFDKYDFTTKKFTPFHERTDRKEQ